MKGTVTLKTDVYSFGVLLWELLTFDTPHLIVDRREYASLKARKTEARPGLDVQQRQGINAQSQSDGGARGQGTAYVELVDDSASGAPPLRTVESASHGVTKSPIEPLRVDIMSRDIAVDWVLHKHKRPPIPSGIPPVMLQLLKDCWHHDDKARPDFIEIQKRLHADSLASIPRSAYPFPIAKAQKRR